MDVKFLIVEHLLFEHHFTLLQKLKKKIIQLFIGQFVLVCFLIYIYFMVTCAFKIPSQSKFSWNITAKTVKTNRCIHCVMLLFVSKLHAVVSTVDALDSSEFL